MTALCVDAGTSMIKAVAWADDGTELACARRPTQVLRPRPGLAEQDMEQVREGVVDMLREVAEQVSDVDLIALTGQGDGCWLVDEAGRPTGPAALWNDARGAAMLLRWERDGTLERAFRINGSLAFPGLPCAILNWYREHEPERVERAHKALYCNGWVFLSLTGEFAIDESDASVPLLDIGTHDWSGEVLELFDLTWARHLLPRVRGMDGRVGSLTDEAAAAIGLSAGLPVVMAPFDIVSTAIGCGAVRPGQACGILGTTLCTEVIVDAPDTAGDPSGFTIAMGVPDRYVRAFPTAAGTDVVDWAVRTLGLAEPAELGRLAESAEPGAGGLVLLPYLSPAGERAPFLDVSARGMLLGLTLEHEREQVARAVLEGLTLVVRDCLTAARAGSRELRLCGGGARSDLWCQLIADATGVASVRSADSEPGAKGAFITALVATGRERGFEAAADRLVSVGDRFEPREDLRALYDERYESFLALREIAGAAWERMAS